MFALIRQPCIYFNSFSGVNFEALNDGEREENLTNPMIYDETHMRLPDLTESLGNYFLKKQTLNRLNRLWTI